MSKSLGRMMHDKLCQVMFPQWDQALIDADWERGVQNTLLPKFALAWEEAAQEAVREHLHRLGPCIVHAPEPTLPNKVDLLRINREMSGR